MPQSPHVEKHFTSSEAVRDIVIGMADGLTVPFALAAGLSGAVASTGIVVTAGLAEVAAGAIAMGLGVQWTPETGPRVELPCWGFGSRSFEGRVNGQKSTGAHGGVQGEGGVGGVQRGSHSERDCGSVPGARRAGSGLEEADARRGVGGLLEV